MINQNHHYHEDLKNNDPEFYELFNNFLNNDVSNNNNINLDERTKFMAIIATLLGCQGYDEFREILPVALKSGLSPVEVKEIIYQAAAYLGIGRVYGFLKITNEIFAQQNINLPVEPQSTTNINTRREAGTNAQVEIFGEGMRNFWNSGPDETKHINLWLAQNCFGDYYTRKGLNLKDRELITFCYISAQGGCEPQLIAHAKGNFNVGNDKNFMIKIISQCLPFIGYPRSLNALRCVEEASKQ